MKTIISTTEVPGVRWEAGTLETARQIRRAGLDTRDVLRELLAGSTFEIGLPYGTLTIEPVRHAESATSPGPGGQTTKARDMRPGRTYRDNGGITCTVTEIVEDDGHELLIRGSYNGSAPDELGVWTTHEPVTEVR